MKGVMLGAPCPCQWPMLMALGQICEKVLVHM